MLITVNAVTCGAPPYFTKVLGIANEKALNVHLCVGPSFPSADLGVYFMEK